MDNIRVFLWLTLLGMGYLTYTAWQADYSTPPRSADVNAAWGASSSAAGALMLLSRAQQELRILLEPPQLQ